MILRALAPICLSSLHLALNTPGFLAGRWSDRRLESKVCPRPLVLVWALAVLVLAVLLHGLKVVQSLPFRLLP